MSTIVRVADAQREFVYDAWANARLRACVTELQLRTVSLWAHLATSKRLWLARVLGEDVDGRTVWPSSSLDDADRILAEAESGWMSAIADLSDAELGRVITFHNSRGEPQADMLSDILRQVTLHGAYHRGQLASLAKASGAKIPPSDFIVFAREQNAPPGDSRKLPATAGRAHLP